MNFDYRAYFLRTHALQYTVRGDYYSCVALPHTLVPSCSLNAPLPDCLYETFVRFTLTEILSCHDPYRTTNPIYVLMASYERRMLIEP